MTSSNIRSSLLLEILLYVNNRFSFIFFFLIIGTYVYKLSYLEYPIHVELSEVAIILLYAPIEALRISWAHQGNLTENSTFLSFSLMLNAAILAICAYMGFFQSYVLLIELILCCIQAGLILLETIFEVVALATFSRTHPNLQQQSTQ